jgi:hypothetical protein
MLNLTQSANAGKRVALRQKNENKSIIPNFIAYDLDLNLTDIRLYMIIESFRDSPKECFASIKWMASEIGTCEREIQRSKARLVKKGYILHYRKGKKWYFEIPSCKTCTDMGDSGVTDYDTHGVTDYDTHGVTDYDTHSIKNKISSYKNSGSEEERARDALPPPVTEALKHYEISEPVSVTRATQAYIESAINYLADNNYTIDIYLSYLYNKCSFILLPYEENGKQKRNGFSVIFKPSFMKRAINGDFEDRK